MKQPITLLAGFILMTGLLQADISLNGHIRNDGLLWLSDGRSTYINVLENKLVMQRQARDWKFYSDLRINLYTSDLLDNESPIDIEGIDLISVNFLRAFIKYYAAFGDLTIGKTYVNFGNPSVFNPFELDQGINLADLDYTKAGITALTFDFALGPLSGGQFFISPETEQADVAVGGSLYTNITSFDLGLVLNRLNRNDNVLGLYFKGDLELGIQGSWAYHMDDRVKRGYSEVTLGLDYSFFSGQLITSLMGYYNGQHAISSAADREEWSFAPAIGSSETFPDQVYLYAQLMLQPDEFIGWQLNGLVNLDDHSSIIMPMVTTVIANGLTLTGQVLIPTGVGRAQYSRDDYGDAVFVARIEAKL